MYQEKPENSLGEIYAGVTEGGRFLRLDCRSESFPPPIRPTGAGYKRGEGVTLINLTSIDGVDSVPDTLLKKWTVSRNGERPEFSTFTQALLFYVIETNELVSIEIERVRQEVLKLNRDLAAIDQIYEPVTHFMSEKFRNVGDENNRLEAPEQLMDSWMAYNNVQYLNKMIAYIEIVGESPRDKPTYFVDERSNSTGNLCRYQFKTLRGTDDKPLQVDPVMPAHLSALKRERDTLNVVAFEWAVFKEKALELKKQWLVVGRNDVRTLKKSISSKKDELDILCQDLANKYGLFFPVGENDKFMAWNDVLEQMHQTVLEHRAKTFEDSVDISTWMYSSEYQARLSSRIEGDQIVFTITNVHFESYFSEIRAGKWIYIECINALNGNVDADMLNQLISMTETLVSLLRDYYTAYNLWQTDDNDPF